MLNENHYSNKFLTTLRNSYLKLKSYRKTAKLHNLPLTTLYFLLKPNAKTELPKKKMKFTKVTERDMRIIKKYISANPFFMIKQLYSELNINCSLRNFYRLIHELRFCHEKLKIEPYLTEKHKIKRLHFASKHIKNNDYWNFIVFTDEKKFNLKGPDGYNKIWIDKTNKTKEYIKKNKLLISKSHKNTSVMVWGSFCRYGVISLEILEGRINSQKYTKMLDSGPLKKIDDKLGKGKYVFQQDNAPCHVSKYSLNFFHSKKITLLDWPACSPDLNPIENLWGILTQRVYKNNRMFQSKKELIKKIQKEWNNIELKICEDLVLSMDSRCEMVLGGEGALIKY